MHGAIESQLNLISYDWSTCHKMMFTSTTAEKLHRHTNTINRILKFVLYVRQNVQHTQCSDNYCVQRRSNTSTIQSYS